MCKIHNTSHVIDMAARPDTEESLMRAAGEIRGQGGEVLPVQVDVSSSSQVNDAARRVMETWGTIDILVNNAATLPTRCSTLPLTSRPMSPERG